ncbi:hypothetical protein BS78_10G198500 [Paspalum vaginatum]|nr:hypothetical protein BS78_10G198500 [Paspalum vaginatum]
MELHHHIIKNRDLPTYISQNQVSRMKDHREIDMRSEECTHSGTMPLLVGLRMDTASCLFL